MMGAAARAIAFDDLNIGDSIDVAMTFASGASSTVSGTFDGFHCQGRCWYMRIRRSDKRRSYIRTKCIVEVKRQESGDE